VVSRTQLSAQTAGRWFSVLTAVHPAGAGSYSPTRVKFTRSTCDCQGGFAVFEFCVFILTVLYNPPIDIKHMVGIYGNLGHTNPSLPGFERLDGLLVISGALTALPD
jgi:hypothetical protein